MRALIFCLLVIVASPTWAQTGPAPSREALTLAGRAARSAQPRLEQGLQTLVEGLANNFRTDSARAGLTVDEKALVEVTKSETDAAKPVLWDGMTKIYAETYTVDELKALNNFYRGNPGAPPQGLPTSLAAKNDDIERRQRELIGQFGPRVLQDFFGDCCSRAPCSDAVRRTAGLPVKSAN